MSLFNNSPSPTSGAFANNQIAAPDSAIVSPPTDGVSSLNFTPAPNANFIVSTSWSGQVQCWEVGMQGTSVVSQPKAETKHDFALDSEWTQDGTKIITCGCDRTIKLWDLGSNQQTVIGSHDAPVRSVCVLDPQHAGGSPVIVTGGWDSKIKYWDLRTNASVGEVQLEAKVYAMDIRDQLLVVGTAEQQGAPAANTLNTTTRPATDRTRKIYCFNLKNPTQPLKVENSPLQYQTRCVAAFPGNAGYLVGSIEGRVGVQNFDGMHPDKQPSYTFKCHRRTLDTQGNIAQNTKQNQYMRKDVYDEVHAVNVIRFHPAGTFMTGGADGSFTFWDKDEKARLCKSSTTNRKPITAASYSSNGAIMAYACCYDWSQGHAHHDPNNQQSAPQIMLHRMEEREFQRRKNSKR